jgi:hypothetical protein
MGHEKEITISKGYDIEDSRNIVFQGALDDGSDYVFFYDDDMIPLRTDALYSLCNVITQNPEMDVLGAVYPRRTSVPEPIVSKSEGAGVFWGWEDGGIHKVWMVGTGFTVYRLAKFKELVLPTYLVRGIGDTTSEGVKCKRVFEMNGTNQTDDFNFAVLASNNNINQYVHGGIVCDQIGLDEKRWQVGDARVRIA